MKNKKPPGPEVGPAFVRRGEAGLVRQVLGRGELEAELRLDDLDQEFDTLTGHLGVQAERGGRGRHLVQERLHLGSESGLGQVGVLCLEPLLEPLHQQGEDHSGPRSPVVFHPVLLVGLALHERIG